MKNSIAFLLLILATATLFDTAATATDRKIDFEIVLKTDMFSNIFYLQTTASSVHQHREPVWLLNVPLPTPPPPNAPPSEVTL